MIELQHKYRIKFDTIEQIKFYIEELNLVPSDALIKTENHRYVIDARSLMGIFSLDLSNYLVLEMEEENIDFINKIKEEGIYIEKK